MEKYQVNWNKISDGADSAALISAVCRYVNSKGKYISGELQDVLTILGIEETEESKANKEEEDERAKALKILDENLDEEV